MDKKIYSVITGVVAIIFSIILWFSYISAQNYTAQTAINTAIQWLVGVLILSLGGSIIGYLSAQLRKTLGLGEQTIWDALGGIISILVTIIIWFVWLGEGVYTIASVINTAIVWLIITVIVALGALLIGYFEQQSDEIFKVR